MTEFTERYKLLSDKELVAILANPEKYQPTAVETAKSELAARKLSATYISSLETENSEEEARKQQKIYQQKLAQEKVKNDFLGLFKNVNPFQEKLEAHEKQIRFLCWILAAISLYTLVTNLAVVSDLTALFIHEGIDAFSVLYLVEFIALTLGTILFWSRSTFGWIFITFFFVLSFFGIISAFVFYILHPIQEYMFLDDEMIQYQPTGTYFMYLFFFGANLYVLLKSNIRAAFQIDSTISVVTVLLGIALQFVVSIKLFAL